MNKSVVLQKKHKRKLPNAKQPNVTIEMFKFLIFLFFKAKADVVEKKNEEENEEQEEEIPGFYYFVQILIF